MPKLSYLEPFHISDFARGDALLNLDVARDLGQRLQKRLEDAPHGSVVPVDLTGLTGTRPSCVRRFLGAALRRLARERRLRGRYLILIGEVDDYTKHDLRTALEQDGVVVVWRRGRGSALIGSIDRTVEETFAKVANWREVHSGLLTGAPFDLKPNTATARLQKLSDIGLLHLVGVESIETGGRRFVYEPVV